MFLEAFISLLRTVKELNNRRSKGLEHWPTYAATLKKLTVENRETAYQLQALTHVDRAKEHYSSNLQQYCSSVTSCLKTRLAWTDLQLVRDIIFYLETQGMAEDSG